MTKTDTAVIDRAIKQEQTKAKKPLVSFDYAIKYLLKDKGNYDILEGFISALLKTQNYKPVKIIALLDTESNKEQDSQKRSLADLVVEDANHVKYIVEIERTSTKSFVYKSFFNVSRLVADQITKGTHYKNIKKIFHISLLYFGVGDSAIYHGKMVIEDVKSKQKLTVHLKDKKTGKVIDATDVFPEYMYVSIPRFNDTITSDADEWLYIMKHEEVRKGCTLPCKDRVEDRLSLLKMSPEERDEYFYYMKKTLTDEDAIETATDKGVEEGIKIGIAEEAAKTEIKVQQARAEEAARSEEKVKLAEARAEGARVDIAKKMLAKGCDTKLIMDVTGFTAAELKRLKTEKRK